MHACDVGIPVFFFQAEDGIRDRNVTGVQTCALPIYDDDLREALRRSADSADLRLRLSDGGLAALEAEARRSRHRRARSEERRVGKECRLRRSPLPDKQEKVPRRALWDGDAIVAGGEV